MIGWGYTISADVLGAHLRKSQIDGGIDVDNDDELHQVHHEAAEQDHLIGFRSIPRSEYHRPSVRHIINDGNGIYDQC